MKKGCKEYRGLDLKKVKNRTFEQELEYTRARFAHQCNIKMRTDAEVERLSVYLKSLIKFRQYVLKRGDPHGILHQRPKEPEA